MRGLTVRRMTIYIELGAPQVFETWEGALPLRLAD
jgi:hypothetical protein